MKYIARMEDGTLNDEISTTYHLTMTVPLNHNSKFFSLKNKKGEESLFKTMLSQVAVYKNILS